MSEPGGAENKLGNLGLWISSLISMQLCMHNNY